MISLNKPFEAVVVCTVFTVVEAWPVVTKAVELDNFRAVVGGFVVIMGNVVTVVTTVVGKGVSNKFEVELFVRAEVLVWNFVVSSGKNWSIALLFSIVVSWPTLGGKGGVKNMLSFIVISWIIGGGG